MKCLVWLPITILLLSSCSSLNYYWQGVVGQLELWRKAEPIADLIASAKLPAELNHKLSLALSIRTFASDELGLPENQSYRYYVKLARPFVVWNVVATPELSLEARQWCFPIAGCVNYRGYFDERMARGEAQRLQTQGDDVHVGGVPAYSTLGYFSDPVLSTFVHYSEVELARLIFHELAHQRIYVQDDTTFNESFAVVVEEEGIRRWLKQRNDRALEEEFTRRQQYRQGFRGLLLNSRSALTAVYAQSLPDHEKRLHKARILNQLQADYQQLKHAWGGYSGYDYWFNQGINNASLAAQGLYEDKVAALRRLLHEENSDLRKFYRNVEVLAGLPAKQRQALLQ